MRIRKIQQGFTLVEIMIVVAIIALLAAIAIPNLLRARMTSNDALAKATLRAISTAAESFGTSNNGNYPGDINSLTTPTPPFLNINYFGISPVAGYNYGSNAGMSTIGYTITATPVVVGSTGSTNLTITTGGVLTAG
jgi:prepilin-type N-terminal cleavage/methylation domain-containing protein